MLMIVQNLCGVANSIRIRSVVNGIAGLGDPRDGSIPARVLPDGMLVLKLAVIDHHKLNIKNACIMVLTAENQIGWMWNDCLEPVQ